MQVGLNASQGVCILDGQGVQASVVDGPPKLVSTLLLAGDQSTGPGTVGGLNHPCFQPLIYLSAQISFLHWVEGSHSVPNRLGSRFQLDIELHGICLSKVCLTGRYSLPTFQENLDHSFHSFWVLCQGRIVIQVQLLDDELAAVAQLLLADLLGLSRYSSNVMLGVAVSFQNVAQVTSSWHSVIFIAEVGDEYPDFRSLSGHYTRLQEHFMLVHPILCHLGHYQHVIVGLDRILGLPSRFTQVQLYHRGMSGWQVDRFRIVDPGTGLTPFNLLLVILVVDSWYFFFFLRCQVFIRMLRLVVVRYVVDT